MLDGLLDPFRERTANLNLVEKMRMAMTAIMMMLMMLATKAAITMMMVAMTVGELARQVGH